MVVYGRVRSWIHPPLTILESRRRARREAAQIRQSTAPVVLVYQMSKVGSRTVYESLQRAGLENPLFHVHFLQPKAIKEMKRFVRSRGFAKHEIPYKLVLGEAMGAQIRRLGRRRSYKIITLVRDPIARHVSGLMQPPLLWPEVFRDDGELDVPLAIKHCSEQFAQPDACAFPEWWFANELQEMFNIDVLAHPFDKQRGYEIISADNVEVLVLRLEDLERTASGALAELFNCSPIRVVRANTRTETRDAAAYRKLLAGLRIPAADCRRIYDRPLWRHFYTPAMLDEFVNRWSGGSNRKAA